MRRFALAALALLALACTDPRLSPDAGLDSGIDAAQPIPISDGGARDAWTDECSEERRLATARRLCDNNDCCVDRGGVCIFDSCEECIMRSSSPPPSCADR